VGASYLGGGLCILGGGVEIMSFLTKKEKEGKIVCIFCEMLQNDFFWDSKAI